MNFSEEEVSQFEYVVDRPMYENKYNWSWGIYAPQSNWAFICGGRSSSEEQANQSAQNALTLIKDTKKVYFNG